VRYYERAPSRDLAAYIRCLWELEGEGAALAEPIFPDGCVEVVVHLADLPRTRGDGRAQPRAMVVGQMLAATRLAASGPVHAVGVRFTPAGACAWLGLPLHELTNRIEDAGAIRRGSAARLQMAIEHAIGTDGRLAAAESAIRATLQPQWQAGQSVRLAVYLIEAGGGTTTVDRLARACHLSARHLERCFHDQVGISPKRLARIVRFQRALRALRAGGAAASVAASCGFADQAHLAREFRGFAGMPSRDVNLGDVVFVQDGAAPAQPHW
jgi:AraC-like DNA-binding protein